MTNAEFTNLEAIRTNSINSTTVDFFGNYVYLTFSYKTNSDHGLSKATAYYWTNNDTSTTNLSLTGDISGNTGTLNSHFYAEKNDILYIVCNIIEADDTGVMMLKTVQAASVPIQLGKNGRAIGLMTTAPSEDVIAIGGENTKEFLISCNTSSNRLESKAQIQAATSDSGQGIIVISTQGIDSSGNLARGTIGFLADEISVNGRYSSRFMSGFVVDSSVNNDPSKGWVWKKYADGTAECWTNVTTSNFNITDNLGNGFYCNSGNNLIIPRNYPFSFSEVPEELVNIDLQGASSKKALTSWFSWYKKNTISQSKGYQVFTMSALNGVVAYINYHVIGKCQ